MNKPPKHAVFPLEKGYLRVEWPQEVDEAEIYTMEAYLNLLLSNLKSSARLDQPKAESGA